MMCVCCVWMIRGQLSGERRDGRKMDAGGFVGMTEVGGVEQRAVGLRSGWTQMRSFRALRTVAKGSNGRLRSTGRVERAWIAEETAGRASGCVQVSGGRWRS